MDVLNQIEWMLNDLLTDRCADASEHEESRLDSIMRFDHIYGARLVQFRCEEGCEEIATKITIVFGHKSVVGLGFDILETRKECSVAKRVFDEGKGPAREDPCNRGCQHSLIKNNQPMRLVWEARGAVSHLSSRSTRFPSPLLGCYVA